MTLKLNETRLKNVTLIRTGDDSVEISWNSSVKPRAFTVYAGESPDYIDRKNPVASARANSSAKISGLDPDTRYYFEVALKEGSKVVVSDRRVPLQGSVNFRDLGGYETSDGRRVKWGQVFRSDNLGRLTDRDVSFVQRMGIRMVCDFRTPAEAKKLPDRFLPTGRGCYLHLPIQHGEFDPAGTFERIKNGDIEWMTEEFMITGYIKNIDNFAPVWSTLLQTLADGSRRPLVFHCTGGKDRAGVCAALILLSLGVPEKTVIYDHGLSNLYIAAVLEKIYEQIRSHGVDPNQVAPYFTAPKNAILAAVRHIRQTYGSAADYLTDKAGVDEKMIKQLKKDLLE
ncbi:Possible protein-tyrosine-phosphatase (EC [Olavius sp. associated proteobacterium Delta 1]|nr:Possible protein-tyrosine-phosphatase (EC [Olavius sp. associated proteobacterium Delta 1]